MMKKEITIIKLKKWVINESIIYKIDKMSIGFTLTSVLFIDMIVL